MCCNAPTESNHLLKIGNHVTWRNVSNVCAARTMATTISPTFAYRDREYHLRYQSCRCPSHHFRKTLCLHCERKDDIGDDSFRPFRVYVFSTHYSRHLSSSKFDSVESLPSRVWTTEDIAVASKGDIDWKLDGRHSFVLIFEDDDDDTMNDTKLKAKLKIGGSYKMDRLPNLDSLSADLAKLLMSGESADFQLKCGGVMRCVHRLVLSARSDVFAAMLRSDMQEANSGVLELVDVDPAVMDIFLAYLYTGLLSNTLDVETLVELYAISDKYGVHVLKKVCSDRLGEDVRLDTFSKVLEVADRHQDLEFMRSLVDTVVNCMDDDERSSLGWSEFLMTSRIAQEVYSELGAEPSNKRLKLSEEKEIKSEVEIIGEEIEEIEPEEGDGELIK